MGMRAPVWLWVAFSLGTTLSGCLYPPPDPAEEGFSSGDGAAPTPAGSPSGGGAGESGSIEGRVVDDEAQPVAGATVSLSDRGRETWSGPDGSFAFADVPAGPGRLHAEADGYAPQDQTITVSSRQVVRPLLTLARLPEPLGYHATAIFEGHYDCAHEVPIWTGDCMILYESQTGQEDPVTSEKFAFRTRVEAGWESVVVELVWKGAANNQLDGMRLYLENGNGTEQGHSFKVARTDGSQSPLRLTLHRGIPDPRADVYTGTTTKAFIPDEGEEVQIRVFPKGKLADTLRSLCLNPSQQTSCLLGVGVGLDIRYTVYATVFYRERAPSGFTAVP